MSWCLRDTESAGCEDSKVMLPLGFTEGRPRGRNHRVHPMQGQPGPPVQAAGSSVGSRSPESHTCSPQSSPDSLEGSTEPPGSEFLTVKVWGASEHRGGFSDVERRRGLTATPACH